MLSSTPRITGGSSTPVSAGVTSLNGLTDAVTIVGGNNTTITESGSEITVNSNFTQEGKYMISGGATWSGTGLTYDVSLLEYFFNGNKTAQPTQVTLDASDPTDNRFDAIVVDESGVVTVITGTASASPETPAIPDDQLQVTFILVEAGSTAPTIASEEIYMDDPTTDWTFSTYDTASPATGTINFAGTTSPKQGTECIEASTDLRRGARFVRATSFDAYQYTMFQVWVRFTGTAVATNKSLNVRFENSAGTLVANTINLFNYGLQRSVLNTWQLVVVPITAFGALPATVKGLKVIMAGGTVGAVRQWDLDYMILTNGSVPFANVPTIAFYKDNVGIGSAPGLNIIQGTGMTITSSINPTTGRADYTLNSSGGGGSLTANYIGYGSALSTLTGDSLFTRDATTKATFIGVDQGSGVASAIQNGIILPSILTTTKGAGTTYTDVANSKYVAQWVGKDTSGTDVYGFNAFAYDGNTNHVVSVVGSLYGGAGSKPQWEAGVNGDPLESGSIRINATNTNLIHESRVALYAPTIKIGSTNIATNYYILPSVDGLPGQNLVTDGNNNVSWENPVAKTIKVPITSLDILSSNTAPVELIPAPGVGKYIKIISADFLLNYGTSDYSYSPAPNDVTLTYGTTQCSGRITLNASSTIFNTIPLSGTYDIGTNTAVNFYCSTGNPTGGDSTVDIYITYTVVTL